MKQVLLKEQSPSRPSSPLQASGLTEQEGRVYLAACELGHGSVLELTRASGLKRTTVYAAVDALLNRHLLSEVPHGKKKHYVAESPNRLVAALSEQQSVLVASLPQLLSIFETPKHKPKIHFYNGIEGIKQVYLDTLEKPHQTILTFTGWQSMTLLLPKFWDGYIKKRIKRDIRVRALADRSPISKKYQEKGATELRELRYLLGEKFEIELQLYGDKIALTNFGLRPFGMIIENESVARFFKNLFEILWKQANVSWK